MYFSGVSPFKAFKLDPVFARYFFVNSGIRVAYSKLTKNKLRLGKYGGRSVLNTNKANYILLNAILKNTPFMFGRYGSTEINCVTEYLLYKKGIVKDINFSRLKVACFHNGLFPLDKTTIVKFSELMLHCSNEVDLFGTFRMIMEDYYIKFFMNEKVKLTHLNVMDFWKYSIPFTSALKGKKILVVHPLASIIQDQYQKRHNLFSTPYILPEIELKTLKAVQTIAGQKDERFDNWFEALEYMYNEVKKIDFDVAVIGCGAYGFPLAAMIKKLGKIAIHMGGVTQMLFGIKGARWDVHPQAKKLYNQHWVRPSDEDVPVNAKEVEGGCYW